MAYTTIPNLPLATSLNGAEQFEVVQNGASRRTTVSALMASMGVEPTVGLYADIAETFLPSNIAAITTAGYNITGRGGGLYVADALATVALATAHPRFCIASLDGRYWRLTGGEVIVEQGGAVGDGVANDQPAIQAATNYAVAVGLPVVRFQAPNYALWCPPKTTVFADAGNGSFIFYTGAVAFVGAPTTTKLSFYNSAGGSCQVITQTSTDGLPWIGHGFIFVSQGIPNSGVRVGTLSWSNLEMNGGSVDYVGQGNVGGNLSNKGIYIPFDDFTQIIYNNCKFHNFAAEVIYSGGGSTTLTVANNLELYNSVQSLWNPTGTGRVRGVNLNAHDGYLPSEIITGAGHEYSNCSFSNGYNCGTIGTQFFLSNYAYTYPNRNNSAAPVWSIYTNTTFSNITQISFGSWTSGSIRLIDSQIIIQAGVSSIDLEVQAWTDQKSANAFVSMSGPPTTTTQWGGCPVGVYFPLPADIRINIQHQRTPLATSNGYTALDGVQYGGGLVDQNSVRITVDGEIRNTYNPTATRPAGYGFPLIRTGTIRPLGQPYGGSNDTPTGAVAYKPEWPCLTLYPNAATTKAVTLDMTYKYADGQEIMFYCGQTLAGCVFSFAAAGTGLNLNATRTLTKVGDYLRLRYDPRINSPTGAFTEIAFKGT